MCIHRLTVSPIIAGSSNNSRWRIATIVDGNGDGLNCNSNHLFTFGPKIAADGLDPAADLWADQIESHGLAGITFRAHYADESVVLRLPLLGR